jgi:hypothetical protein
MGEIERRGARNIKPCIVCGAKLDKNNTTWYRQKNYIHKCNDCIKIEKRLQARAFRDRNPKLAAARSLRNVHNLKKNNPVRYSSSQMLNSSKKRSNALGLPNNMSTQYIFDIAPEKCPVFGWDIKYGGGKREDFSASLDRIDTNLGYVEGNVQVISLQANLMKSNATESELKQFSNWVLNRG